jgi:hypothetical protein
VASAFSSDLSIHSQSGFRSPRNYSWTLSGSPMPHPTIPPKQEEEEEKEKKQTQTTDLYFFPTSSTDLRPTNITVCNNQIRHLHTYTCIHISQPRSEPAKLQDARQQPHDCRHNRYQRRDGHRQDRATSHNLHFIRRNEQQLDGGQPAAAQSRVRYDEEPCAV